MSDTAHTTVATLSFAGFTGGFARYVISPLVPEITASFGVTTSAIGLALSVMWFMFAALQFVGGVLTDRFGEKPVMSLAVALTLVGSLLMFYSPTYAVFVLSVLVVGVGSGMFFVSASTFISRQFTDIDGKIGLLTLGGSVAGLVAPVVAVSLSDRMGWWAPTLLGAVCAAVLLVVMYVTLDPTSLMSMTVATGFYFIFQSTTSFFPTFMIVHGDVSTGTAGTALSGFFLLTAVGNPTLGKLSDYFSRDTVLSSCLCLSIVWYVVLIAGSGLPAIVSGVILLGLGMSFGPAITSRFLESFSDSNRGFGYGLSNTVANMVGSSGSAVTGFLAGVYGWTGAFAANIVVLALALLALVFVSVSGFGAITRTITPDEGYTVGHKQVDTRCFVWRSPRRLDGETPTSVFTCLCPTV